MSRLQALTPATFKMLNPDWHVVLHLITNDRVGVNTYVPDYKGPDHFAIALRWVDAVKEVNIDGWEHTPHGILLSDIVRVQVLNKVGGVYSDFDCVWLRPMSEMLVDDFETTICYHSNGHINQSNIVSEPGGGFLRAIIDRQKTIRPPYTHQAFNSELVKDMYPTPDTVKALHPRVKVIHYETFYPYSIYNLEQLYLMDDLTPLKHEPMCIHWFNGHDLSRAYADDNTLTRPCSMTSILKLNGIT